MEYISGQNIIVQQQVVDYKQLPEVKTLLSIEELKPFVIPDIIPDLLYILKFKKKDALILAAKESDPKNPKSILFANSLNKSNKNKLEKESNLIKKVPKALPSKSIKCYCGSRNVIVLQGTKQMRSGDEGAAIIARCLNCSRGQFRVNR